MAKSPVAPKQPAAYPDKPYPITDADGRQSMLLWGSRSIDPESLIPGEP